MQSYDDDVNSGSYFKKLGCFHKMNPPGVLLGRDNEVELLRETLMKERMKNAILVGEAGVGKTAIVEKVADLFKDRYEFMEFDVVSAVAGTHYRGDFEKKMKLSIDAVLRFNKNHKDRQMILFIDEIHMIYKAGVADDDSMDASNILKPYLSRGQITIIGATTPKEYENTILKDGALSRRLSPLYIKELPYQWVFPIIKSFSNGRIKDDVLNYIYQISTGLDGRFNPDISIEICDRCIARTKCLGGEVDNAMVDSIVAYMRE